jgi:hypothetical protein
MRAVPLCLGRVGKAHEKGTAWDKYMNRMNRVKLAAKRGKETAVGL